ncbi:MAG: hypothetical protein J6C86_08520, partial [Bacteroidaceae bacterium]|nr:hypothetical protein [Bacteroidaceae bacterium]
SNLLSAQICSALSSSEQCAEKVTTVRWKYQNLVDWRKELFVKDKKCERTVPKRNTISHFSEAS